MHDPTPELTQWLRHRLKALDRATIGQLITLMNLVGAESVAEVGRRTKKANTLTDAGVNARQKLTRLRDALEIGDLTKRVGKYTKPTDAGKRVAGEVRLFLQELRAIDTREAKVPTWIIGAGDSWLQSIIIPAIAKLLESHPEWRWEVKNMRAADIRSGVRDGELHFGFFRDAEINAEEGFNVGTRVSLESYRIIVGNALAAPKTAKELVRWVISENRPLVQQGSTWRAIREPLANSLGLNKELESLPLQVACETHTHALAAVTTGLAWCVVPSGLGRILPPHCRSVAVKLGPKPDLLALVQYPRALRKHAGHDKAWDALSTAIRAEAKAMNA
jgi:DNA-binding transcriptional LysR family regulator